MSVEVSIHSVTPSLKLGSQGLVEYDILARPDSGGEFRPDNSFNDNTLILIKPINRIPPPPEPQEVVKPIVSAIYFNTNTKRHLDRVIVREQQFNSELGIDSKENSIRSYNAVHDRVNFEMAETNVQLQAVKNDLVKEGITNLRERYHTLLSKVCYIVDEQGNIYSEDDLSEPADSKFQRGALYRIAQGSKESEREWQTVKAGITAKRKLADLNTSLRSKMIVISPPSGTEGTIYKDNFVDIYQSDKDSVTGQRIIKMYRFASATENEEYKEIITKFKSDITEIKGSLDVWCLSSPIFIDSSVDKRSAHEVFNQEFKSQKKITKEEDFQEILDRTLSVRQNYIEVICSQLFNPKEIAIAFNAILNKADTIRKEILSRGRNIFKKVGDMGRTAVNIFESIKDEVKYWGKQVGITVSAACGVSKGYSISKIAKSIDNSTFKTGSSVENLGGTCDECGMSMVDDHYHCDECGMKYASERNSTYRTPRCRCGREFGC